jgi:tRNA (guanine-N7-)-methyltransferase
MTAHKPGDPTTLNRLYGRSSGHKLRAGQQELIDGCCRRSRFPARARSPRRPVRRRAPAALRDRLRLGRASRRPRRHAARSRLHRRRAVPQRRRGRARPHPRQALANVRLWHGDALEVLRRVPDGALSFVYLLHPDPWPKARHAKRRMVNDGPLDLFAAKLKPGGEFRLATDHPVYLEWTLMIMQRHGDQFEWLAEKPSDFLEPPGGWIETRYGAKSRREGPPALLSALPVLEQIDLAARPLVDGADAVAHRPTGRPCARGRRRCRRGSAPRPTAPGSARRPSSRGTGRRCRSAAARRDRRVPPDLRLLEAARRWSSGMSPPS